MSRKGMTKQEIIERNEEFKKLCEPLVDFIYKHGSPHSKIIIEMDGAEFVDGSFAVPFEVRN